MDISALKNEDFEVWMPFMDAEVALRYLDIEELRKVQKQATKISWDRKGAKEEDLDSSELSRLLGRAAVRGWRGITMEGQPYAYTPEHCDFLMSRWLEFATFVADAALDLGKLVEAQERGKEKNSVLT
jgi:hypothetical protein